MKCLVTGARGLIGGYLVERLLEQGHAVTALDVKPGCGSAESHDQLRIVEGDILDQDAMTRLIGEVQPEIVFHLAAQSLPRISWDESAFTFDLNVGGSLNILNAVRDAGIDPVIIAACSSGEYAPAEDDQPISETGRLNPSSPYGISKMALDHLAGLYSERYGMRIIRVRPFYLAGPRKKGDVCSDFARAVVAIERGKAEKMLVGNLEVVRDIMHIQDGVSAFLLVAEKGKGGEVYNICTGAGVSIGDILEGFRKLATVPVHEEQDPELMRPIEEMVKIGDPSKLRALGWEPAYTLDEMFEDILEFWRNQET